MRAPRLAWLVSFTAAVFLVAQSDAKANTINYGAPPADYRDCTPFCTSTYQQLFNHALFPGPGFITAITLYYFGTPTTSYTLELSTSSSTLAGGLATSLAANIGSNNQVFYSGLLPSVPFGPTASATLLGTPFFYDPSQGDLLLNITRPSAGGFAQSGVLLFGNPAILDLYRRNYAFGDPVNGFGSQVYGNVTQFEFVEAVPEPASVAVLGLAGAAIGLFRRRASRP